MNALFESAPADGLLVVDLESLIPMKRTKRAKAYAVIGELAGTLPPQQEIELTTDADRIVALASVYGAGSPRPSVQIARAGGHRKAVLSAPSRRSITSSKSMPPGSIGSATPHNPFWPRVSRSMSGRCR